MSVVNDLGAIRVFVAVANAGSFAKAAELSGLTRSAIGKAIARLEGQLGARLFQRSTRRLGLTGEGELFHERFVQILSDLDEVETITRQALTEPAGTLRVTVPDAYGRLRVLPILHHFLLSWPRLRAEVNFSDQIADVVEDGYDLAVRIGAAPSEGSHVSRVVARSKTIVCAAPAYLANQPEPQIADDLLSHRRLAFGSRRRSLAWELQAPDGAPLSISGRPHLLFDSAEALREAALLGHGLACLPDFLVRDDIAAGRLLPLLLGYSTKELPIYAIYASRRHLPSKVRLFIDALVDGLSHKGSSGASA